MTQRAREALIGVARDWDRAMITNDAAAIGKFMSEDWIIVGADGRTTDKATFLSLIESGALSHDEMESTAVEVRIYGEAAVLLADGISGGLFKGHRFHEVERASNVFVRQEGMWRCVLTHLSTLPREG
jgi:ketosteroid isomerase-like protein